MNLISGINQELKRCWELLQMYGEVGPPGVFASTMLKETIKKAEASLEGGDVIEMMRCYQELKESK